MLNISLDRKFPYIHDIVMGIRSVSPGTLIEMVIFRHILFNI